MQHGTAMEDSTVAKMKATESDESIHIKTTSTEKKMKTKQKKKQHKNMEL